MRRIEDLKLGTKKDIEPKGVFEMASIKVLHFSAASNKYA